MVWACQAQAATAEVDFVSGRIFTQYHLSATVTCFFIFICIIKNNNRFRESNCKVCGRVDIPGCHPDVGTVRAVKEKTQTCRW